MRTITIQEAIAFLKTKHGNKKFYFFNGKCDCLYTQVARRVLKSRGALCHGGGSIRLGQMGKILAEAPSHDIFWGMVYRENYVKEATASQAIKHLETLQAISHVD